ncbi:putative E3 ubiquitin-protein ligase [Forsythia ovata]|uniref:E3 ubiquitin-protein ligase n=1 Tax=Forsythia ovata TaxID=205694 RepID=A0ABD1W5Y7_9LAMI
MAADLSHALVSRPGCGGPLPSSIDNYRVLTLFDSGLFLQIAKYNLSTSLPVGDGGANDEEGEGGGGDEQPSKKSKVSRTVEHKVRELPSHAQNTQNSQKQHHLSTLSVSIPHQFNHNPTEMGGCCCCASKSAELNNSSSFYQNPRVLEEREPLSRHAALSALSTGLLVDTNLDTSVLDTYQPPPAPIPYETLVDHPPTPSGNREGPGHKVDVVGQTTPIESIEDTNSVSALETKVKNLESDEKAQISNELEATKEVEDEKSNTLKKSSEVVVSPLLDEEDVCPTCLEDNGFQSCYQRIVSDAAVGVSTFGIRGSQVVNAREDNNSYNALDILLRPVWEFFSPALTGFNGTIYEELGEPIYHPPPILTSTATPSLNCLSTKALNRLLFSVISSNFGPTLVSTGLYLVSMSGRAPPPIYPSLEPCPAEKHHQFRFHVRLDFFAFFKR